MGYGKEGAGPRVLDGFDASFHPGITGLVGPNGAGKTTFLRTACGLLEPVSGKVEVGGQRPGDYLATHGVGFLPEKPMLPPYLTVGEFLDGLPPYGPPTDDPTRNGGESPRIGSLLEKPVTSLSHGEGKKVALAAFLKGGPRVLLLDEPTNGLDPMAVMEVRSILLEERDRGATIIVSSHHLDELQRVADAYVFVHEGHAVGSWTRGSVMEGFSSLEALFYHLFEERSG